MKAMAGAVCGALSGVMASYLLFFQRGAGDDNNPLYLAIVLPLAALGIYWATRNNARQRHRLLCYAIAGGVLIWLLSPAVAESRRTRVQKWLQRSPAELVFAPNWAAIGTALGTAVGAAVARLLYHSSEQSRP